MRRFALLSASFLLCASVNATAISHPTFVLVHGALLTSNSWMAVQSRLQNAGYNVVTVDVPGRADDGVPADQVTLDSAAAKVCKVAAMQVNSVILVGHSQGGAVITQALDQCSRKIKSLVYVAAVAPLNGESTFQDLSQEDNDNFDACTRYDKSANVYEVNYQGPLKAMFMADATDTQAERAIHNMVAEPAALGEAKLHYSPTVFANKPKYYIETAQDKIISRATQYKIEKKINATEVYGMVSSHSPFISQPDQLANILINIANRVKY